MKKIVKIALAIVLCILLAGCGNAQMAMAKNLDSNLQKLTSTMNSIPDINTRDIIVASVMPEIDNDTQDMTSTQNVVSKRDIVRNSAKNYANELAISNEPTVSSKNNNDALQNKTNRYSTRYQNGSKRFKRTALDTHISGLEDLYSISSDVICANDDISSLKSQIIENCGMLSTLCGQIKKNKINISAEKITAINELISTLSLNCNRLNLSKNEVNIEANSIKNSIKTYYSNMSTMSSKYVKLLNCMDTRISNYKNILNLLSQIQCLITGNCSATANDCIDGDCYNDTTNTNNTNNSNNSFAKTSKYNKTNSNDYSYVNPNEQYFEKTNTQNEKSNVNQTSRRQFSQNDRTNIFPSRNGTAYDDYRNMKNSKSVVEKNEMKENDVNNRNQNQNINNTNWNNRKVYGNTNTLSAPRNPFESTYTESNIESKNKVDEDNKNIYTEQYINDDNNQDDGETKKPSSLEKRFSKRTIPVRKTRTTM